MSIASYLEVIIDISIEEKGDKLKLKEVISYFRITAIILQKWEGEYSSNKIVNYRYFLNKFSVNFASILAERYSLTIFI